MKKSNYYIAVPRRTKVVNIGLQNDSDAFEIFIINIIDNNQSFGLAVMAPTEETHSRVVAADKDYVEFCMIYDNSKYMIQAYKDVKMIIVTVDYLVEM